VSAIDPDGREDPAKAARVPAQVSPWVWPAIVGITVLLLVGRLLIAADDGWPLGESLVALAVAGGVVLASVGWSRSRRHRD